MFVIADWWTGGQATTAGTNLLAVRGRIDRFTSASPSPGALRGSLLSFALRCSDSSSCSSAARPSFDSRVTEPAAKRDRCPKFR